MNITQWAINSATNQQISFARTTFERKLTWLEIHKINNENSKPVFSKK